VNTYYVNTYYVNTYYVNTYYVNTYYVNTYYVNTYTCGKINSQLILKFIHVYKFYVNHNPHAMSIRID
jgi:hypothetical protein